MWIRYERSKQKHVGGQHVLSRIYSQTGIEDDAFLNTNPVPYAHTYTQTHRSEHGIVRVGGQLDWTRIHKTNHSFPTSLTQARTHTNTLIGKWRCKAGWPSCFDLNTQNFL